MFEFESVLFVVRAAFLVLMGVALADLARLRDRYHLDVALLLSSVAFIVIVLTVNPAGIPALLFIIAALAASLQPYLLMRLIQHIQPTPPVTLWITLVGLVVSWIALLVPAPRPEWLVTVVLAYFIGVNVYAAWVLAQTARKSVGIPRRRSFLAAFASLTLALLLLLFGIYLLLDVSTIESWLVPLGITLVFLMALAYYLGFTPPRPLLRVWQQAELYRFLRGIVEYPPDQRDDVALLQVSEAAAHSVGAAAAHVALQDPVSRRYHMFGETRANLPRQWLPEGGVLDRAWRTRDPVILPNRIDMDPQVHELAVHLDAQGLIVVPILTTKAPSAFLLIWLRYLPFFVQDDLRLLTLFAKETATALDHAALHGEMQLQSEITRNMAEGIVLIRAQDARIVYANPKFEEMFGYAPGELVDQPIAIVNAPGTRSPEETARLIVRELREKGTWSGELYNRKKDGAFFWCYANIATLQHPELGEVWVSVHSDITERKQAEQEIYRLNADLEARVHARTVDLETANEKLQSEIAERQRAQQELSRTNLQLQSRVQELQEIIQEITTLNALGEALQACLDVDEVMRVTQQHAAMLFAADSGAVGILDRDRQQGEWLAQWGDLPPLARRFASSDCMALRRGRIHVVRDSHQGLTCRHLPDPPPESYRCIPLMAQGEVLGVFYLASNNLTERKQQLAVNVGAQLELTLANLWLRESLREQSIRDPLTNLYNRRYLEQALERHVVEAIRLRQRIGVMMLDLDHFKEFNDALGHDAGDVLLQSLGHFLVQQIRPTDIVCRYGGEEFAVILPNAPLEAVAVRGEMLRLGIKNLKVEYRGQVLPHITISIGVACFPQHGSSGADVLRAADRALYAAKAGGRDAVVVADLAGEDQVEAKHE